MTANTTALFDLTIKIVTEWFQVQSSVDLDGVSGARAWDIKVYDSPTHGYWFGVLFAGQPTGVVHFHPQGGATFTQDHRDKSGRIYEINHLFAGMNTTIEAVRAAS